MKFGDMLIKEGVITQEHLKLALERQVIFGGRIGTNLVELGLISEEELTQLLSKYLRVKEVDADKLTDIHNDVIQTLSAEIASHYRIVPFKKEKSRLHVAMVDVKNVSMIDELKFKTGYDIVPYIVSEIRLLYALEKYYGIKRDVRYISVFDGFKEKDEHENEEIDEAAELKKLKEAFIQVNEKGEIAGLIMNEAWKVAKRIALFIIKKDMLEGWVSKGIHVDGFSAKIEPESVISDILSRKTYYRGPILNVPGNQEFISLLGGTPQDCLIMPVGIRDRVVCVLYADNGNKNVLSANLNYLNSLVTMASIAFEIIILKQRIMDL